MFYNSGSSQAALQDILAGQVDCNTAMLYAFDSNMWPHTHCDQSARNLHMPQTASCLATFNRGCTGHSVNAAEEAIHMTRAAYR